ncbi:hypothetical protein QSV36_16450 [Pseudomonas sp. BCRC 81390]|uniref:hypothetical protein n=1 Tax=Pseudomonas sp. BCRC 81390 TaxID=3054778 RepID=UPI0025980F24|nr:hypothetical protein [Pseudomonas sp. BCRC 81390]MDM3887162.1 hypothetical protein [Pseudomonas sp. BCRC 81390]
MNRVVLQICGMALLCLFTSGIWAMSGPEIADALNMRLADTPEKCAANQPDYACSGVLVRPMAQNHPYKFWEHDSAASQRGSEMFVYLRSDLPAATVTEKTGFILMNRFEALAQDKVYDVSIRPHHETVEVANWDDQTPAKVAVQALYYRLGVPGALWRGQRHQLSWYRATGEWLPLLRYQPNDPLVFGFAQSEQLYEGYAVAARVNARYVDTAPACPDGSARYNCNGVWVRGTGVGNFRAWNNSPDSKRYNAVSFSFFAADTQVVQAPVYTQGYILKASGAPAAQPITLRCMYPQNGGTSGRNNPCSHQGNCRSLGITTAQQWNSRYNGGQSGSCAFDTDQPGFQLAAEVRKLRSAKDWNEAVMNVWPDNVPADLPLEAFYYRSTATARENARRYQREFNQDTAGGYLPVLALDTYAANGRLVEYRPEDQYFE